MTDAEHAYVAAVGTGNEEGAAVVLYEKGYDADWLAHLRKVATQSPQEFAEECERAARRQSLGELGLVMARVPVSHDLLAA
jgi:hypothetical protein